MCCINLLHCVCSYTNTTLCVHQVMQHVHTHMHVHDITGGSMVSRLPPTNVNTVCRRRHRCVCVHAVFLYVLTRTVLKIIYFAIPY